MNIVIANSVGIDKKGKHIIHSPSRWSEGVDKAHCFAYYPWQLAYLSGLLKARTEHNVKFVDGCLLRMSKHPYYELIKDLNPDVLIMESASRVIKDNLELALAIKKNCGTRLIFAGAHATVFPEDLIRAGVDNVCIGEYEYSVLELIESGFKENVPGVFPNKRRALLDINSLPWPEDDDVRRIDYGMPGEPSSDYLEIQMYASRGCPGNCNFCVARHVYYDCPNWRCRNVDDIVNEIAYLKNKYPELEGVFFDEEAHNGSKEFILRLSKAIVASGLNGLRYEAMCDVRFLDEQVLKAMKEAGYYKIRFGIETASVPVMERIHKKISLTHIREMLGLAKSFGMKTYGTFTFGALGSTYQDDLKTIDLMKELIEKSLLDGLQLSICTPQPGTPFYLESMENGFLRDGISFSDYDGGSTAVVDYPGYSHKQIQNIKQKALIIRDHLYLKNKIEKGCFRDWVLNIFKRYGLKGLILKAYKRLILELRYLILKRGS